MHKSAVCKKTVFSEFRNVRSERSRRGNTGGGATEKRSGESNQDQKGFGRKIRTELPLEERIHDVSPTQKHCTKCGCERTQLPFTEDSEEIDFSYRLVRIRHKRAEYKQACACKNEQPIVTARCTS